MTLNRSSATTLIDVNFVVPENALKRLIKGNKLMLAPIGGVLLLLIVGALQASMMLHAQHLEQQIHDVKAHTIKLDDKVTAYTQALKAQQQLTQAQQQRAGVLPEPPNWEALIGNVVQRLPGIGGAYPTVTLKTFKATTQPSESKADFGLLDSDPYTLAATFQLSGSAKSKEAVTASVHAFESDPHYAVVFTGTSNQSKEFSFGLKLALLKKVAAPPAKAGGTPAPGGKK